MPNKKGSGRWQKEIAEMPPSSSKTFPASKVRTEMNSFYRAAKSLNRFDRMESHKNGSVTIHLTATKVPVKKRGAK